MERAGANLDRTITQVLRRVPTKESVLLAWPVACGSAVADRTRALSFEKGVLSVEVPDQGWRRELTALAGQYLAAINRFSSERIQRIEFVVHK
jgi:predicted nucleic acid-binding Zn ribbon protein